MAASQPSAVQQSSSNPRNLPSQDSGRPTSPSVIFFRGVAIVALVASAVFLALGIHNLMEDGEGLFNFGFEVGAGCALLGCVALIAAWRSGRSAPTSAAAAENDIEQHKLLIDGLTSEQKATLGTRRFDENTITTTFPNHTKVTIEAKDIFASGAQVIVNAANAQGGGGTGINGAIHRLGGEDYRIAHSGLRSNIYEGREIPLGEANMIGSGSLKGKYNIDNVIVVVGPQGPETTKEKRDQLYNCYYNSLCEAHKRGQTSIAFPAISTGVYAFNKADAAAISLKAIHDFATNHPDTGLKTISIHFLPTERQKLDPYMAALSPSS